jgi:hypothetical protein
MKYIYLFALLIFAQIASGQTGELAKVPGTKCSLIPPKGFVAATRFSGFQNSEIGASIILTEIPGSYRFIVDGMTAEKCAVEGIILTGKQTIDLNGLDATMLNASQYINGITYLKQMLVFGDPKNTVLVNGVYPEGSKIIARDIKTALLSTVCKNDQKYHADDAFTFTIDVVGTDFKLAKSLTGNQLYSIGDQPQKGKPTLIISCSISKVFPKDKKAYSEKRLNDLPIGNQKEVQEINEVTIDNLDGFEITAKGLTQNGPSELIYQVMLYTDDGDYYLILGTAKEESGEYLEGFKKIARTFKRK